MIYHDCNKYVLDGQCGTGKHLFKEYFIKHMRRSLGELYSDLSVEEVFAEFRGELARTIVAKLKEMVDLHKVKKKAKQKESMSIKFLLRTRHWSDGVIIESKAFVREVSYQFHEREKVLKRKFSQREGIDHIAFYCFENLRKDEY